MSRLIFILVSLVFSLSLFSQKEFKDKLRGTWILYGIKEMPYYSYENNFQTSEILNDSALILEISNEEFRVFSKGNLYYPLDTVQYNYEIICDSNRNLFIDLDIDKKTFFKRQKKDPFRIRGVYIMKLNNTYLTLERLHKESNSLFSNGNSTARSYYYFKRINDSINIFSEEEFEGTWFNDLGYNFSFGADTIILLKDTCWVQNTESRTQVSLDFIIDNESSDYVRFSIFTSWGSVGRSEYGEASWILYPDEKEIHFIVEDEIVGRYKYLYENDKFTLIKNNGR